MNGFIYALFIPFERYQHELLQVIIGLSAVAIYSWTTFNTWVGTEKNVRRGGLLKRHNSAAYSFNHDQKFPL